MIKKLILTTISACILAMGASAGAATVTSVVVSDFDKSIVTVEGTLDATETGTDVYVVKKTNPQTNIQAGKNYASQGIIVQPATVTEAADGTKTFSAIFKFNAPGTEGGVAGVTYNVYAANSTPKEFMFIDKESVYDYVDDTLATGTTTTYEDLGKFGPSLGADVSFAADSPEDQQYLLLNIKRLSERLEEAATVAGNAAAAEGKTPAQIEEAKSTARVDAAKAIINLTKAELEFMAALASTVVEGNVDALVNTYASVAEIDMSIYGTTTMSDTQKMQVCNQFIGKTYTDMKTFRTDWTAAVTAAQGSGQPIVLPGGELGGNNNSSPSPVSPSGVNNSGTSLLSRYNDVAQAEWAVEAISYVVGKGIMQGTSQNTFEPNVPVTREQVAKIIAVAFNKYNSSATASFADVPKGHWSASYIGSAYASGLLTGKSATEFGLGEKMTREDLCTVMYRAATMAGYNFANQYSDFIDFESVNSYAQEAVRNLAGAKIISGMGDGVLAPKGTATRAQTAQMLMKLAELIK